MARKKPKPIETYVVTGEAAAIGRVTRGALVYDAKSNTVLRIFDARSRSEDAGRRCVVRARVVGDAFDVDRSDFNRAIAVEVARG